ncbi:MULTISPECIES: hypothetical protein [Bacteroidales]|uniref:hypothetical protein n=1 Tax=Bacteroidales TaxID=171549 RepID=UPI00094FF03B|nr:MULTISPECIES: hypothetical protein [Bacteroidales]ATR92904.1 hypothetical protein CS545_07395 [Porphyromonas gingivalis]ATS07910.1 hypothetical protein CS388_01925 [Porphyromonas gingivalis]OLQ21641.1 hypothetical protein BGK60_12405 [Tannerella forsythia]SJL22759.1 hypothetical protein PGIN_3A1_01739 [Porphyromonas gingivalis]
MKKLKILLYGVLSLAVAAGIFALKCYLSPIEIYEMPINAWKRPVYSTPDSTQRQEFFVIYNYLGKSDQQIRDSITAYNDRTISPDTIRKYKKGYYRAFYKRDWTLNKHYAEEPDGSDIIFDHGKRRIFSIRWEIDRCDILVDIKIWGESYRVPISDSTWHIISSVRLLESNDKYLLFPRKVEE